MRLLHKRPIDASFHGRSHRQLLVDVPVEKRDEVDVDSVIVLAANPVYGRVRR